MRACWGGVGEGLDFNRVGKPDSDAGAHFKRILRYPISLQVHFVYSESIEEYHLSAMNTIDTTGLANVEKPKVPNLRVSNEGSIGTRVVYDADQPTEEELGSTSPYTWKDTIDCVFCCFR